MTPYQIPLNRPYLTGAELTYMAQASRSHIAGNGVFTEKCQLLMQRLGAKCALLTLAGTAAFEMSALLLDLQPGDEIIVPSLAIVSTVNAFALRGARPVFIDIHPSTLNLDESRIESCPTSRTKAIVALNYGGVAYEMDAITNIAARYG